MYESQVTGECGSFFYMLRNLIGRDYKRRPFLNLKWARYTLNEDDIWVRQSLIKAMWLYIKENIWAQIALAIAVAGDILLWAILL